MRRATPGTPGGSSVTTVEAPPAPVARLCVGVTGHRLNHAGLQAQAAGVRASLAALLAQIDARAKTFSSSAPRLHSMLADGADQFCADAALACGWELVAPLPFGLALAGATAEDCQGEAALAALAHAQARAAGAGAPDPAFAAVDRFFDYATKAQIFALADRDAQIERLYRQRANGDAEAQAAFAAETSHRYTLASRVIVEQSDLLIALWDGVSRTGFGGTGHTIAAALDSGVPVAWIRPDAPEAWRILRTPEDLADLDAARRDSEPEAALSRIVEDALRADRPHGHGDAHASAGMAAFLKEAWPEKSNRLWHGYRRIEAMFGESGDPFRNLTQTYARPDQIADGAWRDLMARIGALPGLAEDFVAQLRNTIAPRFAFADGISTHLSDAYRGGMILNFALSAIAAVGGLTYMPFFTYYEKPEFAIFELTMLCAIVLVTQIGGKRRWHGRWFESRRVAEYLRHNPILLAIGVARPAGRWPRGVETSWPEWYARQTLREIGLPRATVTPAFLRAALELVLQPHVVSQRDYHLAKAKRLRNVHDNLDKLSMALFICAIVVVAGYVTLKGVEMLPGVGNLVSPRQTSQFTYFGVVLPLLGATIAGVRYFGDFERFSSISEVAAEKLDAIAARIAALLRLGDADIDYEVVARLAHAIDDVVVGEIESWQAVFGGKHITIPV